MKREDVKQRIPGITDEQLDWVMNENGSDINREKEKLTTITAERDNLQTRLNEANGKLEGYDPQWKAKAEQAKADAEAQIAGMKFDSMLSGAITKFKGKNAKAIAALLDVDTLKGSKNQEADIQAALEAVKKDNGYLFDDGKTPPPYAGGTGTDGIEGNPNAALRAAFGLPAEKK